MSTRANIVITDGFEGKLYFYRHSDGYPDGVMPTLNKFLALVKKGKIRDNAQQASGWLIILGAIEYQTIPKKLFSAAGTSYLEKRNDKKINNLIEDFVPEDWKVGAYEPTEGLHGDIEYLYTVDLKNKEIVIEEVHGESRRIIDYRPEVK